MTIYLHQDFHNAGLGLAMLTKLVELAKKEGLHRIGLQVVADNKCAAYLYEKLGVKIEGTMKDHTLVKMESFMTCWKWVWFWNSLPVFSPTSPI